MSLEFLDLEDLLILHERILELTPLEPAGVHSFPALESAINAPINLYYYNPDADIAEIAASYAVHISRNHPFQSGNKRVAMAACIVFLEGNGFQITLTGNTFGVLIENTLKNLISFDNLASFIRCNITQKK